MTLCCQGTRRNEASPRAGPPDLTDLIGPPSATRPPGPTAAAPRSDPLRTCASIDGAGYQTLQSNIATAATLPDCGGTPTTILPDCGGTPTTILPDCGGTPSTHIRASTDESNWESVITGNPDDDHCDRAKNPCRIRHGERPPWAALPHTVHPGPGVRPIGRPTPRAFAHPSFRAPPLEV